MPKKSCSLSVIFILFAVNQIQAQPQSDLPRIEFGGQYTVLHLPAVQEWADGFGGRFGYYLFEYVAVEGEFNHFPVRRPRTVGSNTSFPIKSGLRSFGESLVLIGIKAGIRTDKFGLFGKVKPGFIHLTDKQTMFLNDQSNLRFALEIGGVLEYYFSRLVAFRLDMGETWIDFSYYQPIEDYQPQKLPNRGFQAGAGIVFRF